MSRDHRKIVLGAAVGGGVGVVFLGVAVFCSNIRAWFLMPVSVPVVLLAQVTTNVWVIACGTVGYFAGVGTIIGWLQQSGLRYKRHLSVMILVVLLAAHTVVYQFSLSNIYEVIAKALVDALIRGATTTPP